MDGPALGLLWGIEVTEHEQGLRIALLGELVGDQECAVLRLDVVRSGEELLREGHSRVRLHLALERVAGDLQPLGALDVIGGVFHGSFLTRGQIRRLMLQDFGGLFLQRRVRFGQDPRIDEVSGPGKQNDREDSKDNVENKALVAFGAFLQIQQFAGRDPPEPGFPSKESDVGAGPVSISGMGRGSRPAEGAAFGASSRSGRRLGSRE